MRRGFTLIELLVVIAIIAILAAILFPVFAKAREKARQASCFSTSRNIAQSLQVYCVDYDGYLPTKTADDFWRFVRERSRGSIPACPSWNYTDTGGMYGYGFNSALLGLRLEAQPVMIPMSLDWDDGFFTVKGLHDVCVQTPLIRHNDGANVVFVNGQVKWQGNDTIVTQTAADGSMNRPTVEEERATDAFIIRTDQLPPGRPFVLVDPSGKVAGRGTTAKNKPEK